MALRKIARLGQPVLLRRAREIDDTDDPELRRLIVDMSETLVDARGLGLAAPQVYASMRVVLVRRLREEGGVDFDLPPRVLINPELETVDDEVESAFEGCLSIPDLRGLVPRARRVGWRATDLDGRRLEGEAEGLFARILQHEVDHLDGILYPMRMHDLRMLAFDGELQSLQAALAPNEEDDR